MQIHSLLGNIANQFIQEKDYSTIFFDDYITQMHDAVYNNMKNIKSPKSIETINRLLEIHKNVLPHLRNARDINPIYPQSLEPSNVINKNLGSLVEICNEKYTHAETHEIFEALAPLHKDFQDISNRAEEQMEKSAENGIFYAFNGKNNELTQEMISQRTQGIPQGTEQYKIATLEAIMNDIPKHLEKTDDNFKGYPFPYLSNYVHLSLNELRLFKLAGKEMEYRNVEYKSKDGYSVQGEIPNLKGKTITFIGAGFPLSGLMLQIYTGAKIKLIDMDKDACEKAENFLEICHNNGVIDKSDFEIIHGNAMDFEYNSKNPQNKKDVIQTDIIQMASALPKFVKKDILSKTNGVEIIDRYVSGLGKLLYYDKLSQKDLEGNFKIMSKIYPEPKLTEEKEDKNNDRKIPHSTTAPQNINSSKLINPSRSFCM